jgi:hypothetical protein
MKKSTGSGAAVFALIAMTLLALEPAMPVSAQEAAAPAKSLQIVILDDEAPLNNISERTAREPIVQVQDENHKPVAGAAVLFAIHPAAGGASALFANGASTLSVVTNSNGVARASGLVMNQFKGTWQLQVTASKDGLTTSTNINETNVQPNASQGNTNVTKPPTHWALSKGATIAGGIAVVGAIVAVVVIEAAQNSSTHIGTGPTKVGAPTDHSAGFRIHF